MSLTLTQARDEMMAVFHAAWDTTGHDVFYTDQGGPGPSDRDPWARVLVQHNIGFEASLRGAEQTRKYRREGLITVQLFTPAGDSLSSADTLGKLILDAFEGKKTPGGAWFRNARYNEVGPDGDFYQCNVLVDFEYDEIK